LRSLENEVMSFGNSVNYLFTDQTVNNLDSKLDRYPGRPEDSYLGAIQETESAGYSMTTSGFPVKSPFSSKNAALQASAFQVAGGVCRLIKKPQHTDDHIYEGQTNALQERHGFGRQIYTNGDCYIGQWQNDQYHGIGLKIEYETGIEKEGEWHGGKLIMRRKVFAQRM